MTKWSRIKNFLLVLLQLFCVLILLVDPLDGVDIILAIMQVIACVAGIRYLVFYFTMARYMVGGRAILYQGAIYIDLGVFLGMMINFPTEIVMICVIGYFVLCGIYRGLKVLDTRKIGDRKWLRLSFVTGWYLLLAMIGLLHLHSTNVMVWLFCVEMTLAAFARLVQVFRNTDIIYIQ